MIEKARRTTALGTFVLFRHDAPQTFNCGHCKKEKTSKNVAEFTPVSGPKQTLCNGCHGELLAKG